MKITFISDTHGLHHLVTNDLPGGDILVHCGDIMNSGLYETELKGFCEWYDKINNYDHKIFIAGNHDRLLENNYDRSTEIINEYKTITYLQDSEVIIDGIKFYGSPWQPEFLNWAFNLKRGEELKEKWDSIPEDIDVLITHGPSYGKLDVVDGRSEHLGCEDLKRRIEEIKPSIHCCGHIHSGHSTIDGKDIYNKMEEDGITYINASILNERYEYYFKPITIDYES